MDYNRNILKLDNKKTIQGHNYIKFNQFIMLYKNLVQIRNNLLLRFIKK